MPLMENSWEKQFLLLHLRLLGGIPVIMNFPMPKKISKVVFSGDYGGFYGEGYIDDLCFEVTGGGQDGGELQVDVWTDKGGQGLNVKDGSYKIDDPVIIYYSANKECTAKLTITKPDGTQLIYGPNTIPAGTRSKNFEERQKGSGLHIAQS